MPRYVVLEHQMPPDDPRGLHWDFMFEAGEALRTWSLPAPPSDRCDVIAEALPDHRLAYLDYEGPISGGRGEVERWDAGQFVWLEDTNGVLKLRLEGDRLRGEVTLVRETDQRWRFSFSAG